MVSTSQGERRVLDRVAAVRTGCGANSLPQLARFACIGPALRVTFAGSRAGHGRIKAEPGNTGCQGLGGRAGFRSHPGDRLVLRDGPTPGRRRSVPVLVAAGGDGAARSGAPFIRAPGRGDGGMAAGCGQHTRVLAGRLGRRRVAPDRGGEAGWPRARGRVRRPLRTAARRVQPGSGIPCHLRLRPSARVASAPRGSGEPALAGRLGRTFRVLLQPPVPKLGRGGHRDGLLAAPHARGRGRPLGGVRTASAVRRSARVPPASDRHSRLPRGIGGDRGVRRDARTVPDRRGGSRSGC